MELLRPKFAPYLHATGPPVDKVGVAQFEFQAQSQEDTRLSLGNGKHAIHQYQKDHEQVNKRPADETC